MDWNGKALLACLPPYFNSTNMQCSVMLLRSFLQYSLKIFALNVYWQLAAKIPFRKIRILKGVDIEICIFDSEKIFGSISVGYHSYSCCNLLLNENNLIRFYP